MRSKRTPSYLFKTPQDIFYFRIRVPNSIRIKYNNPKTEIRKSLNTRDISVALKKARFLWVIMEETDYTMKNKKAVYTMEEVETAMERDNYGRQLLKRFLIATQHDDNSDDRDMNEETIYDTFVMNLSDKELLTRRINL